MSRTNDRIEIHRHNERVAFHFDDTHTIYLSVAVAEKFANVLHQFTQDIRTVHFTDSVLPSAIIYDDARGEG